MLYTFELPIHTLALPLMGPGWAGAEPPPTVTFNVCGADEPQELSDVTLIIPPVTPATVLIEVVVEVPVHPDGKVHVYPVAPGTAVILYMFELPLHTGVLPLIVPGCAGIALLMVTINDCDEDCPQVSFAVTVMVPPVVPAIVLIEFVVEVPVHPAGKVHV